MRINAASGDRRGGRARVRRGGLWRRRRRRSGTGTGTGRRDRHRRQGQKAEAGHSASRPTSPASACRPARRTRASTSRSRRSSPRASAWTRPASSTKTTVSANREPFIQQGTGRPRGRHVHDQRRAQAEGQLRRPVLHRRPGPAGPDRLHDHRSGASWPARRSARSPARRRPSGSRRSTRTRSCRSSTRTPSASTALAGGQVDAVTTDDIILAGYASQAQYAGKFKVVGKPFSERAVRHRR